MPQSIFRLFEFDEFNNFLRQTTFQRKITFIQNHHTWKPNYSHFNNHPKHMILLENMRNDHIKNRKWSDIGQNITIFPDGVIGVCRSIDITPAGIFGANAGGICIESLGNFDEDGDVMTSSQKEAIIKTNAAICIKFGLKPIPLQVVYHHWYDTKGKRFTTADIDSGSVLNNKLQKTCPGTNFFRAQQLSYKGNTIQSAIAGFYPQITMEMEQLNNVPIPSIQPQLKKVIAGILNVRAGRGTAFDIIRKLNKGIQLQVFHSDNEWSKISANGEEWVSSKFLENA